METSANLAIDPESVDLAAIAPEALRNDIGDGFTSCGWYSVEFEGVKVDFPRPLTRMASNGWVAEGFDVPPAGASAELGRAMLEGTAQYLQRFVAALKQTALPEPLCDQAELAKADAYIATLAQ